MPTYVSNMDDDFDSTFAIWTFDVPKEYQADFDLIMEGKFAEVSEEYKARLYQTFPKLIEKYDAVFNPEEEVSA